jgi:hypothetical protein
LLPRAKDLQPDQHHSRTIRAFRQLGEAAVHGWSFALLVPVWVAYIALVNEAGRRRRQIDDSLNYLAEQMRLVVADWHHDDG